MKRANGWFVIIPANTSPNNNLTLKSIVRDLNNQALATTLSVTVAFTAPEAFQATLSLLAGFESFGGNPLLVKAAATPLAANLNIITLIVRGGANPGNYVYNAVPVNSNSTGLGVSSEGVVYIKAGTAKNSRVTMALTIIIADTGLGKELTEALTQTLSVIYGLDDLELSTEPLRTDGLTSFPEILTITVANNAQDLIKIATLGVTLENINSPENARLKQFITTYIYEAPPASSPAINTLTAGGGFTVDINASYALSLRNSQGKYTLHTAIENKLFVTLSKQHALKVHFEPPIDYQRLTIMKLMGSTLHADESILTLPTGSPPFAYHNAYSGGDLINNKATVLVPSGLIVDTNKHLSLTIKIADQHSSGAFARVGVSLLITAVSSVRAEVLNTLNAQFVQEDIIYILKEGLSRDPNADEPHALGQTQYVATLSVSGGIPPYQYEKLTTQATGILQIHNNGRIVLPSEFEINTQISVLEITVSVEDSSQLTNYFISALTMQVKGVGPHQKLSIRYTPPNNRNITLKELGNANFGSVTPTPVVIVDPYENDGFPRGLLEFEYPSYNDEVVFLGGDLSLFLQQEIKINLHDKASPTRMSLKITDH